MDDDSELLDDHELPKISTGNAGLDDILWGGIDPERMYLFEGQPGSGKTTLALEFLLEGVRRGEPTLYITLSETERELRLVAKRHGWSLKGVTIFELIPPETSLDPSQELTVLHPAEIELNETTQMIFDRVETLAPARIVLDSLSELRLLAQSPLRYRRQILALKHFFSGRKSTVVLLDDLSSQQNDLQLHSIAHGVVLLEQLAIDYGAQRRRLRVVKMRGIDFKGGFHDFTIRHGGLKVYPRLVAAEHHKDFDTEVVLSANPELDSLLGGGLERGTNALLIGAAGVGKSSLALTYAIAAASRNEHSVIFAFDEGRGTMSARAKTLGLPLQDGLDKGLIDVQQIDPAEMAPGEFADAVRRSVEVGNARVVIIDSLNGYQAAMPDENSLILHIHELLQYLNRRGAATFMTVAQHGLVGDMKAPVDVTYLADTVILLRFFEALGAVRRAMSIIKKRTGAHESTIREYRIDSRGLTIGEPLEGFQGILRGVPVYVGENQPLLQGLAP